MIYQFIDVCQNCQNITQVFIVLGEYNFGLPFFAFDSDLYKKVSQIFFKWTIDSVSTGIVCLI